MANRGGPFFFGSESNPDEPDAIEESSLVEMRLADGAVAAAAAVATTTTPVGGTTAAGGPPPTTAAVGAGRPPSPPRFSCGGMAFDLGLGEGLEIDGIYIRYVLFFKKGKGSRIPKFSFKI